jgi:hypothetical protein
MLARMPTRSQKVSVLLAFAAAAVSLLAVGVRYARQGDILVTPLGGGLLMLALGISGYLRLRRPRA